MLRGDSVWCLFAVSLPLSLSLYTAVCKRSCAAAAAAGDGARASASTGESVLERMPLAGASLSQPVSHNQLRTSVLQNHEALVCLIARPVTPANLLPKRTVFPLLKHLECASMTSACVPRFPSLQRLRLDVQSSSLA